MVPENALSCWFCAFFIGPGKSREFLPVAENSNAFTSCLHCKLWFHLDNSPCNSRNFSDLGLGPRGEGGCCVAGRGRSGASPCPWLVAVGFSLLVSPDIGALLFYFIFNLVVHRNLTWLDLIVRK